MVKLLIRIKDTGFEAEMDPLPALLLFLQGDVDRVRAQDSDKATQSLLDRILRLVEGGMEARALMEGKAEELSKGPLRQEDYWRLYHSHREKLKVGVFALTKGQRSFHQSEVLKVKAQYGFTQEDSIMTAIIRQLADPDLEDPAFLVRIGRHSGVYQINPEYVKAHPKELPELA